jgi:hypothetical protein
MIETASNDEAIEWASRFLLIHGDGWEITAEVRRLDQPESS